MGIEAERVKTKVCLTCDTDVSRSPRIKDKYGNYFCEPCWNRENAIEPSEEAAESEDLMQCPMCGGSFGMNAMAMSGVCKRCASRPSRPTLVKVETHSGSSQWNISRFFLPAFVIAGLGTAGWMMVALNLRDAPKPVHTNNVGSNSSASDSAVAENTPAQSNSDLDPMTELYRQLKLWKESGEFHPWLYHERTKLGLFKVTTPVVTTADGKSITTIEACIWVGNDDDHFVPMHMHYLWVPDKTWKVSGTVVNDPDPEFGYLGIPNPNTLVHSADDQPAQTPVERQPADRVVEAFCDRHPDLNEAVHRHNNYDCQRTSLVLQQMVLLGEENVTVAKRVSSYMSR